MGRGRSRLHAHLHCAVPGDLSKNASLTAGLPDAREVMASTPGNSAIAHAQQPVLMAEAMKHAIVAGRMAYLAGRMPKKLYASASSPLDGLIK